MLSIRAFCRSAGIVALSALTLVIPGCKGDTKVAVTQGPAGSYTLSVASVSVVQGASNTTTITLNRLNGLTAIIGLSVEGVPVGLTASINPTSTTQSTAVLTVTATSGVAASTYSFTVRGISSGLGDQLATVSVTVTSAGPAGNFTLAGAAASVAQGGASVNATINITRTGGFASTISFSATGAPVGLTVLIAPVLVTTGANTVVTLTASGTLAPGTYNIVIHGTATGVTEQVATLVVTVTAAGGGGGVGNVTIDFSGCAATGKPIWVAFQDGNGAWTRVTGTGDVYRFTISSAKGGYAYVDQTGAANTAVNVQFNTVAEMTVVPIVFCPQATKTYTGTVAGLTTGDLATVSVGGGVATIVAPTTAFTLNNVQTGTFDLVGYRRNLLTPGVGDHGLLRRDVNAASGTALPLVDFNGAESFVPVAATITITGSLTGDSFLPNVQYLTGAACTASSFGGATAPVSSPFTAQGVPAANQRASDFHQISMIASSTGNSTRSVIESFHTFANRTIALPPDFPAPTVVSAAGPYKVLAATFNAAGYNAGIGLQYTTASGSATAQVFASNAYLGATAGTLTFPDLTPAGGFTLTWMPASGATTTWTVFASGTVFGTTLCAEGARIFNGIRIGSN